MFTNKIEAIKALRALPTLTVEADSASTPAFDGIVYGVKAIRPSIGLKDAKDFVEAVMAFALKENQTFCKNCNADITPFVKTGEIRYCPRCGGAYRSL